MDLLIPSWYHAHKFRHFSRVYYYLVCKVITGKNHLRNRIFRPAGAITNQDIIAIVAQRFYKDQFNPKYVGYSVMTLKDYKRYAESHPEIAGCTLNMTPSDYDLWLTEIEPNAIQVINCVIANPDGEDY